MKWILILLTVVVSSAGDILCAKGMSSEGELHAGGVSAVAGVVRFIVTRRLVIMGICCYAVAFFSLMGLLSVAQLSVAVPATAMSFVIDTVGARLLLHEHITGKRWLGVACVTIGVILVVQPSQQSKPPAATDATQSRSALIQPSGARGTASR